MIAVIEEELMYVVLMAAPFARTTDEGRNPVPVNVIVVGPAIVGSDFRFGSSARMQLVVPDIHKARTELHERGVDVSDVQEFPWGSFVWFRDPDGNGWSVQQLPAGDR